MDTVLTGTCTHPDTPAHDTLGCTTAGRARSTSLEARLPLLFWLSLPDAFCRCLSLQHFVDAVAHTFSCAHAHTDIRLECVHAEACEMVTCTRTHTYCTSSQRPTHAQANPHHPWVMNNICLSIPPSLPLAWLLASSWLHCHNVILSASLSPITKMCSDNQPFFSLPTQAVAPHIRPGAEAAACMEAG